MDKAKTLIHLIEQDKVKESDETVEVEVTSKKYNGKATDINSYDLFSDDMGGEPFWKRIYLILVPQGGAYVINADNDQDALDELIDWAEDNAPGLLIDQEEEGEYEDDEYYRGGNHGRMMSFDPGMFVIDFQDISRQ